MDPGGGEHVVPDDALDPGEGAVVEPIPLRMEGELDLGLEGIEAVEGYRSGGGPGRFDTAIIDPDLGRPLEINGGPGLNGEVPVADG